MVKRLTGLDLTIIALLESFLNDMFHGDAEMEYCDLRTFSIVKKEGNEEFTRFTAKGKIDQGPQGLRFKARGSLVRTIDQDNDRGPWKRCGEWGVDSRMGNWRIYPGQVSSW